MKLLGIIEAPEDLVNKEYVDQKIEECSGLTPTGVEAGTYGGYDSSVSGYKIPKITVDENGVITNITVSTLYKFSEKTGGGLGLTSYDQIMSLIGSGGGSGSSLDEGRGVPVYFADTETWTRAVNIYGTVSGTILNGVYVFPRILAVHASLYVDAEKEKKYWVPVEYRFTVGDYSKYTGLTILVDVKLPAEYAEFNTTTATSYGNYIAEILVVYEKGDYTTVSQM